MQHELAIIGAGPAGYAAAIYANRAGISTLLFDKGMGGGLAAISPNIENYPGFDAINGFELTEKMKAHAQKYTKINFGEEVKDISKTKDGFTIQTSKQKYDVKAVLLCMGTEYRKLNAPGEKELSGKGVSYCATCDGFFFKGKVVAVVGGGNSALIESIYLKQIGCKEVYVIHRRDRLRAEKSYEDEAIKKGVKIIYNTHVEKIIGNDKIESIQLHDVNSGKKTKKEVDGIFISIGEIPQSDLAKKIGIKLDDKGYIITDNQGRTNIKGIYAAGDITGGLRQVVTACAEGAIAALASTESVGKKYPY
jgi:thioredoxin reductase (NADPH)